MGFSFKKLLGPIGAAAGGALGGPMGAMVGGSLGGILGDDSAKQQRLANEKNYAAQQEFAQHGIRWKVADAKAAGINPLVALGAPTASFQSSFSGEPNNSAAMGAQMGQDIGRAMQATRTQDERDMANLQLQSARLDLEGKALDNQIKNSQLSKLNSTGPAMPGSQSFIPGQGNSGPGLIQSKPMERTASLPGAPHSEPGAMNDVGWAITADGGLVPVPSKDVKERTEDIMPHEWSHFLRNNVAPYWGGGPKPPLDALPKGAKDWEFKGQAWYPVNRKGQSPLRRSFGNSPANTDLGLPFLKSRRR